MPKKGKAASKEAPLADAQLCHQHFGLAPGDALTTPMGVTVQVRGMGQKDSLMYVTFPGGFTSPIHATNAAELRSLGYQRNDKAKAESIGNELKMSDAKFYNVGSPQSLLLANTVYFESHSTSTEVVKEYFAKHFDPVEAAKKREREAAAKAKGAKGKKKGKKGGKKEGKSK